MNKGEKEGRVYLLEPRDNLLAASSADVSSYAGAKGDDFITDPGNHSPGSPGLPLPLFSRTPRVLAAFFFYLAG